MFEIRSVHDTRGRQVLKCQKCETTFWWYKDQDNPNYCPRCGKKKQITIDETIEKLNQMDQSLPFGLFQEERVKILTEFIDNPKLTKAVEE